MSTVEAIRKNLPDVLSRPDYEMVALDYFRRLGHDNQRRLSKLYIPPPVIPSGVREARNLSSLWGTC